MMRMWSLLPPSGIMRPEVPAARLQRPRHRRRLRVPVSTVDEIFPAGWRDDHKIVQLESQVANVNARTNVLLAHNLVVQQRVIDIEKL